MAHVRGQQWAHEKQQRPVVELPLDGQGQQWGSKIQAMPITYITLWPMTWLKCITQSVLHTWMWWVEATIINVCHTSMGSTACCNHGTIQQEPSQSVARQINSPHTSMGLHFHSTTPWWDATLAVSFPCRKSFESQDIMISICVFSM